MFAPVGFLGSGMGSASGGAPPANPLAASILSKLSTFWPLDDAAAFGAEPKGGKTLTTLTAISSVVGVRGDVAAGFNGTTSVASAADDPILDVSGAPGAHCFFGWYYSNSNTGNRTLITKWDTNSAPNMGYDFAIASPNLVFSEKQGSNYNQVSVASPATGAWHFAVGWVDPVDSKQRFQIDDGTIQVSTLASTAGSNSTPLSFGNSTVGSLALNGRLQRWGWMNADILTAAERTYLYNAGQGKTYAELLAGT